MLDTWLDHQLKCKLSRPSKSPIGAPMIILNKDGARSLKTEVMCVVAGEPPVVALKPMKPAIDYRRSNSHTQVQGPAASGLSTTVSSEGG